MSKKVRPTFLLLLLLVSGSSWAAPLKALVTYAQFQSLVKEKVSQVPDLEPLWDRAPSISGKTYFAGGALRGLLLWIHDELQTKSMHKVWFEETPSVEELLLQKDADMDLLAPTKLVPNIEASGYEDWDVLDLRFMQQSASDGGVGLDRIAVSPRDIRDPLRGLRDFYDGKLVFHERKVGSLGGNTPMALALRYLRFAKEFERAVRPDAASIAAIRRIGATARLPENSREEVQDTSSIRYWVKKALGKYVKAYADRPAEAFVRLKELGLLEPLARGYYFSDGLRTGEVSRFVKELAERGFTPLEISRAGVIATGRTQQKSVRLQAQAYALGKTDSEKEELLRYFVGRAKDFDVFGYDHTGRWRVLRTIVPNGPPRDRAFQVAAMSEVMLQMMRKPSKSPAYTFAALSSSFLNGVDKESLPSAMEALQKALVAYIDMKRHLPLAPAEDELTDLLVSYESARSYMNLDPPVDAGRIRALLDRQFPRGNPTAVGDHFAAFMTEATHWDSVTVAHLERLADLLARHEPERLPQLVDVLQRVLDHKHPTSWQPHSRERVAVNMLERLVHVSPEARVLAERLQASVRGMILPYDLSNSLSRTFLKAEECRAKYADVAQHQR